MRVLVCATRPPHGADAAARVEAVAGAMAAAARSVGRRLLVVGGAAPLRVPGSGRPALEDPRWLPPVIRPIAAASLRQLEVLAVCDEAERPPGRSRVVAIGW